MPCLRDKVTGLTGPGHRVLIKTGRYPSGRLMRRKTPGYPGGAMIPLVRLAFSVLETTPQRWIQLANKLPHELFQRKPAPMEWSGYDCLGLATK